MDSVTIGGGGFSKIKIGKWNGQVCAFKIQEKSSEAAQNELEIMKILRNEHKNIVRMLGSEVKGDELRIYLEYASNGSLEAFAKKSTLDDDSIIKIFHQLKDGLQFLHSTKSILHRDIKPDNILLFNEGTTFKLADFGLSKLITNKLKLTYGYGINTPIGTYAYMAPELFQEDAYSTKECDVWALGATLMYCMLKQHLFAERNVEETIKGICAWSGFPEDFKGKKKSSLTTTHPISFDKASKILQAKPRGRKY